MAVKYGRRVKELMVEEMKEVFSDSKGFVLSSIENIKASEIDSLRKSMRKSGSRYMVLKNRLAEIAFKEAGCDGISEAMKEKSIFGVGVITEDPVQIAKIMVEFSKKNKGFKVRNGYFEGTVLPSEKVKELSQLPGREQLIAMLLGVMNGPIRGFAGVLSATIRSVMHALNAIKDKKETE